MSKTAVIHARTTPDLKSDVERILKKLGMNTTDAINLYFNQIRLNKGLPFKIKIPNETTIETFKETDKGKGLVKCKDADDMFRKLGV